MNYKCQECRFLKTFINNEGSSTLQLNICVAEPAQEDEYQDNIYLYLDVTLFDSSDCFLFKKK